MNLLSAIFLRIKYFIYPVIEWRGVYHSWREACSGTKGYQDEIMFEQTRNAHRKAIHAEAISKKDNEYFSKKSYSWPIVFGLLWIAANKNNRLNIIDFGGSLGVTYFQSKYFINHIKKIKWSIVEQKHLVRSGNKEFADGNLHFYDSLASCLKKGKPHAILLSGVLHCLANPYRLLAQIKKHRIEYILIDRMPFLLNGGKDIVTKQYTHKPIYESSAPSWFFNLDKFLSFLRPQYTLIKEFIALEGIRKTHTPRKIVFKGFIFKLNTI